jgi:hypothetical protein
MVGEGIHKLVVHAFLKKPAHHLMKGVAVGVATGPAVAHHVQRILVLPFVAVVAAPLLPAVVF